MDNYYDIKFKVHNAATDSWQAKVQTSTKDLREAKASFGAECSRLFGSKDFDFVCVTLSDTFGNVVTTDFIDDRVVPEPTPETES